MDSTENKTIKKTNYQRLWRQAKKEAAINQNFAEEVINAATLIWEDKTVKQADKFSEFQKYVKEIRSVNTKALANL